MCDVGGAFEAARKYIRGKKKLMSAKVCEIFIKDVFLVFIGVRDAYMFESFACSEDTAVDLIDNLRRIFGVTEKVLILTIETGDVIVILDHTLRSKLEAEQSSAIMQVIDVNGSEPSLSEASERGALSARISTMVSGALSGHNCAAGVVHVPIPTIDSIGPVLFAGWCLGYPFVYHYTPDSSASEVGCRALSMTPLLKVSLLIEEGPGAVFAGGHPFMEFTAPQCFLQTPMSFGSVQFDSIDELVASISTRVCNRGRGRMEAADWLCGGDALAMQRRIRHVVNDFQIAHVML